MAEWNVFLYSLAPNFIFWLPLNCYLKWVTGMLSDKKNRISFWKSMPMCQTSVKIRMKAVDLWCIFHSCVGFSYWVESGSNFSQSCSHILIGNELETDTDVVLLRCWFPIVLTCQPSLMESYNVSNWSNLCSLCYNHHGKSNLSHGFEQIVTLGKSKWKSVKACNSHTKPKIKNKLPSAHDKTF